ncbi:hypothetical protein C8J57DRAFT_1259084 [Mycena rebaudengoi]|nr:hypothetical protein C8J57DRAFT_1259084 [Mycena rebaudengoi]
MPLLLHLLQLLLLLLHPWHYARLARRWRRRWGGTGGAGDPMRLNRVPPGRPRRRWWRTLKDIGGCVLLRTPTASTAHFRLRRGCGGAGLATLRCGLGWLCGNDHTRRWIGGIGAWGAMVTHDSHQYTSLAPESPTRIPAFPGRSSAPPVVDRHPTGYMPGVGGVQILPGGMWIPNMTAGARPPLPPVDFYQTYTQHAPPPIPSRPSHNMRMPPPIPQCLDCNRVVTTNEYFDPAYSRQFLPPGHSMPGVLEHFQDAAPQSSPYYSYPTLPSHAIVPQSFAQSYVASHMLTIKAAALTTTGWAENNKLDLTLIGLPN